MSFQGKICLYGHYSSDRTLQLESNNNDYQLVAWSLFSVFQTTLNLYFAAKKDRCQKFQSRFHSHLLHPESSGTGSEVNPKSWTG